MQVIFDLDGVTGLVRTALQQLNVDPALYAVQVI